MEGPLSKTAASRRIPVLEECFSLLAALDTLPHIAAHCLMVRRVALFLGERLAAGGHPLDLPLTGAAALLHDVAKTRSITTGEPHAETGARFLAEKGLAGIGEIVRQHVVLDTYAPGPLTEAMVVNYADKRVLHDTVVTLSERMDYILSRYGKSPEARDRIQHFWRKTREIETRLFGFVDFAPRELAGVLGATDMEEHLEAYRARLEKATTARNAEKEASYG